MKRIFVLGAFGYRTTLFDGQTIKTRNLKDLLEDNLGVVDYYDTQDFQFNTVISKYRELTNAIYNWVNKKTEFSQEDKNVFSFAVISLIKLMSPVTVHLSEEIWHELGNTTSIHDEKWCEFDENLAKASKITLVIQINGKVKDKMEADEDSDNESLKALALNSNKIKELTANKEVVKVIVVPKKLVNIVIKG